MLSYISIVYKEECMYDTSLLNPIFMHALLNLKFILSKNILTVLEWIICKHINLVEKKYGPNMRATP